MISNSDMNEMTYNQMIAKIKELDDKVEKRKETCRKSSKKYYDKKFALTENPTPEQVKANKEALEKRDKTQQSYYEKNKEKVKARQKAYRLRIKAEKLALKEKETPVVNETPVV
tara:strand:+ start:2102 stop:2443 length:342 start_codon:yes stop_codon:yes gene_type:complete